MISASVASSTWLTVRASLVQTTRRDHAEGAPLFVLCARMGRQGVVSTSLVHRHLQQGSALAVGDLELQTICPDRISPELLVRPQDLVQGCVQVRKIHALIILVQVLLITHMKEELGHVRYSAAI